jgi:hypothetical protein
MESQLNILTELLGMCSGAPGTVHASLGTDTYNYSPLGYVAKIELQPRDCASYQSLP